VVSAAAGVGNGDGDTVFIPPGYGHVTINPSDHRTLVMANVVSNAFLSEYRLYVNVNYSHQNQLNENNPGRKDIAHDKRDIPPLRALRSEVFNDLPALALRQGTSKYRGWRLRANLFSV